MESGVYSARRALLLQAIACYEEVLNRLEALKKLYPYPLSAKSANPRLKDNAEPSIALMQQAKAAEEKGVAILEELLDLVKR